MGTRNERPDPAPSVNPVNLTAHWPGLLICAALATLVLPSYVTLASTVWASDEQGHGPIILLVTLWLMWGRRRSLLALPDTPAALPGWSLLIAGLVLYAIGRSQQVDTLEVFAHLPLIASALSLTKGWAGLRWGAFYLFFLLFMVPLPGLLVQALTTPLKIVVSYVAEALMHNMGFPVARTGVILYVGQYQLLVADACAGLNSMFTLEALGLLYMNLMNYTSVRRNALLAALIIPIAFSANVVRVMVLVLVTYHYGDETGQGFVHDFAGMVLFLVALTLMLLVDGVISRIAQRPSKPAAGGT